MEILDYKFKKIKIDKNKIYYFSGIGGIGMSAIAKFLIEQGYKIEGSDINKSEITEYFRKKGYNINIKQISENIKKNYIMIKTDAISENNPELIQAKKLKIPIIPRASILEAISKLNKRKSIAVSGTHGKTTTTTILSHILEKANIDITAIVGGIITEWESNVRVGQSDIFIYEACEAFHNFKYYNPDYLIITSIDEDHIEQYGDIQAIKKYFTTFINKVAKKGMVLLNLDDPNIYKLQDKIKGNIKYYSTNYENIKKNKDKIFAYTENINNNREHTEFKFIINKDGNIKEEFIKVSLFGENNIKNTTGALSIAYLITNGENNKIYKSLEKFRNAKRRFELVGQCNNAYIYNDYSHHPKEIDTMLDIAKIKIKEAQNQQGKGKIIVIFQPHLYSRTQKFYKEFAISLKNFDEIVIVPIYPARESPIKGVSEKLITDEIQKLGKKCYKSNNWEDAKNYIKKIANKEDIIITAGAGDIGEFYKLLIT